MKNIDANGHVRGESLFIDDIINKKSTLHAAVLGADTAHAKNLEIDTSKALQMEGVEAIYLAKDVPGENQIGGILLDEPLLAEGEIHFQGQPLALIIAESEFIAKTSQKADSSQLYQITCHYHCKTSQRKQAIHQ